MNNGMMYGLLLFGGVAFLGCTENRGAERKGPPPIQVSAQEVKTSQATYYDVYPGAIVALNQVEIRPEISGYVTGIFFKDGQRVRKGTKLYAIDQQLYKAAFDQASANLNVARANLAKAQEDADRYRDLAKSDAVARQTLEHAVADLRSAKMQVAAAEASVKSARTNLQYSDVTAPFAGTIGISSVKMGSAVTAGQTLLNTLSSDDPVALECSVDEKQIVRFSELMQKNGGGRDSTFTIVLPNQETYLHPGTLTVMDRSVDPQTGTIRIRVTFPNPENVLRAGLTCNLRVLTVTPLGTILVPGKAVIEQMGEYFVYVVEHGVASERKIRLGRTLGENVVVSEGLQVGQQIVTEGVQRLRDNAPVVVVPTQTGSAAQTPSAK